MNKTEQIKRDKWVPLRVSTPSLLAVALIFFLPNTWWGIIIKIIFTFIGVIFINSAYQMGPKLGYPSLGIFATLNAVLLAIALAVNITLVEFIAMGWLVLNWGFIYSEYSSNRHST